MKIVNKIKKYLYFIYKNKYIPKINSPKTFNEKVLNRMRYDNNPLYVKCADKIAVKDYVKSIIGGGYVIENLYVSKVIDKDTLLDLAKRNGDIFVKANHNSGPVFKINQDSNNLEEVVRSINDQLQTDYGRVHGERWYSKIEPQVLVEKSIATDGKEVNDFKFHIFSQGKEPSKCILQIDYDRNTNHNRSFFDDNLNWLPFSMEYPCVRTQLPVIENFQKMKELALELAKPFDYVRVDFYNIDGDIYFGELTFAHEAGSGTFSERCYDQYLGNLWKDFRAGN
ncbi:glycosyltransferase [Vibrio parahaemolyticus]|nr:glycosyltransferase [Vibrio parahaemolyticus]ELB2164205.1 glycosyltransferase [Vibrio parahaemolyticus]ELB2188084.1 glycosyltransferase [Vibrio parahaemolyticus]ELB2191306.1 glycosyltransferase [Vibrio parahaemolyticus]ELB2211910.1 glycosyltransferase [Vibrio parahaemolyticus]